jgi:hypothetical protein
MRYISKVSEMQAYVMGLIISKIAEWILSQTFNFIRCINVHAVYN